MRIEYLLWCLIFLPSMALGKVGANPRNQTDYIVLHSVGGYSCENNKWTHSPSHKKIQEVVDMFQDKNHSTSIHYIIDKKGDIKESTPVDNVAIHVYGRPQKKEKNDNTALSYNESSIGIELLNDGDGVDEYPTKQIDSLVSLIKELMNKYNLKKESVVMHSELDVRDVKCNGVQYKRRTDPGKNFPINSVKERL